MARRRKNRTHLKGKGGQLSVSPSIDVPKSFVIKHGHVGTSLTQLTRDIRKVMEPNTATRLRERSRNKLKDFLTMAPALQVTHLLAFTLTDIAPSLRIVRLSNGPTLSFRVERYSLVKDVISSSRHANHLSPVESMSAPLLVLASFPPPGPSVSPHLTFVMKTFQTLFPPLAPHKLALSSARRVVLVAYNAERGTIDWRHFRITVKPYGISRRVRRVLQGSTTTRGGAILDLGNERDVADYVLRTRGEYSNSSSVVDGYESAVSEASSVAEDDADVVSLAEDYVGRNNRKGQKRAVRLDEIGPRMELRLVKITEGIPGKEGAVIYHEFVKKTKAEMGNLKASHIAKEKLRKERREEQERNVQRKMALAGKATTKATAEEGIYNVGDSSDALNEDEDNEEASWDEDEEISEGEVSEDDNTRNEKEPIESESESEDGPPKKKKKSKQ
ncbi:Brix domain-containing protein [Multifurca ochricompacta]|uniref:Brix domain-containing protein n=1 Tax=Multifurca ochricompacta TaxID=376703 RepID=A0AAD4MAW4_9AGAM|nr:Brix domain-containing protein [Multifurca ochricompacta]